MAHRDVVVVGASAGGVEALRALVAGLPADLPAAVLVVLHLPRSSPSALPAILARAGSLPVHRAVDGDVMQRGHVYVAPPDRHLLVLEERLRLSHGPSENGHRPAVDPLFRSAARCCGPRAVGVILSGARDDGAAGLAMIARHGGITIVQDPADALHSSMPLAAIDAVRRPDYVSRAAGLGAVVAEAVARATVETPVPLPDLQLEKEVAMSDLEPVSAEEAFGKPAGYGCPACGGSLFEMPGEPSPRYRCRIGHAWSPQSLLEEQSSALEGALWMALRALEEKASLCRRLAENAVVRGSATAQARNRMLADDAEQAGDLIRGLIDRLEGANAAVLNAAEDIAV